MLLALGIIQMNAEPRHLYLFDTFAGMTEPTEHDSVAWTGQAVREKWEEDLRGEKDNFSWWAVSAGEVRDNLLSTSYPKEYIHLVEGDVLRTLPSEAPERIALLRLDTDWYESTRHELEQLYPRLVKGGVLLLDDYGHFTGAKKAVDEFFSKKPVFLHRDDYTGRSTLKT